MNKNSFVVGFMLFAIFFGAGNLIFPPKLGLESGEFIFTSAIGFTLTGVGLPLLGIVVSAFYEGGYKQALNRISPIFSLIFLSAIYLSIGPFFAIPRTATTSFEMTIAPFFEDQQMALLIFTLAYFILSLWLALSPSKMVERVGKILTPTLLVTIAALVIKAVVMLSNAEFSLAVPQTSYFFNGMIEGYLTMDALAALAFSVLVISAIQSKGVQKDQLARQTISAGLIAAVALMLIYLSLAWIGSKMPLSAETAAYLAEKKLNVGTYLLNQMAFQTFGSFGQIMLGLIVTLACLTTAVGLIVSVSEYFHEVYPKISYKVYAIVCTLVSLFLANKGLSEILKGSLPALFILYPIAISVMLVLCINIFHKIPLLAQRLTIAAATIISICSVLGLSFTEQLPLKEYSMEWAPFALAGLILGYILAKLTKAKE